MKKVFFTVVFCILLTGILQGLEEITTSDVYAQAVQIEKEIDLLKRHLGITDVKDSAVFTGELMPRHVWQKNYFILTKINFFRSKIYLPALLPQDMEPILNLPPGLVYEQALRVLTELTILKRHLGITERVSPPGVYSGKVPTDVFNKLHFASMQMDVINNEEIDPNYVFAESIRIYEDIVSLLQWMNISDSTYPPAKMADITQVESLAAAFDLIDEIQRLQRSAGVDRTDLSIFHKSENVLPSDVFNIVGMALAEIQTLKAAMDMVHANTVPAGYFENKTAADVHQLLRWTTRMLRLIGELR